MDACCVDITVEFLTVAFHNMVYYACVYPKSVFETRKKYGVVVYRCLNPEVIEYIDCCLRSVAEALKTDALYRLELIVTEKRHEPVFKFVFDFERLAAYDDTADAYLVRFEQNLRAFFLQLATVSQKFNGNVPRNNFGIYLFTNESLEVALANMPHLEEFPLVEAEERERVAELDNIMPIRSFTVRNYRIDGYIELPEPWSFT